MRRGVWVTLIALLWIDAAGAEPAGILFVESTQASNAVYQTGDLIHQNIRVGVESAYTLEAGLLPSAGAAVADGLEVRRVSWTRAFSAGKAVYRVTVVYQLFKTVDKTEQTTVPALSLGFLAGARRIWLEVPAWSFAQPALIDSVSDDSTIKSALPPLEYDLQPTRRMLAALTAALLLVLSYALLWRRLFRALPPFAAAGKNCRRLLRNIDNTTEQAILLTLHRAVDRSAGYALFSSDLARFLAEHPEFADMDVGFQRFFYISDHFFYANNAQIFEVEALYDRLGMLEQFCADCAARET